jgi:hypothetical protein
MWRDLSNILRELRRTFGDGFSGSYRPDLHYMRGPGPKWHAKYGHLAANGGSHAGAPVAVLREAAERRS